MLFSLTFLTLVVTLIQRGHGAWLSFRREKVPGTAPIAFLVAWFQKAGADCGWPDLRAGRPHHTAAGIVGLVGLLHHTAAGIVGLVGLLHHTAADIVGLVGLLHHTAADIAVWVGLLH